MLLVNLHWKAPTIWKEKLSCISGIVSLSPMKNNGQFDTVDKAIFETHDLVSFLILKKKYG